MRPFRPDEEATVHFTVTPEMTARFGERPIHPVLATAQLVYYAEWAARLLLEPHLEDEEEGVGAEVHLRHLEPVAVGREVQVSARAPEATPGRLACRVEAHVEGRRVAEGTVIQAVLPRERWLARMRGLSPPHP